MKVTTKPINFKDDRGVIRDIFANGAPDCVTLITSAAGSVRGNHLHKLSTQHAFVVSGYMLAFTRDPETGELERIPLVAGDMITHHPNEAHAYLAIDDVVFLAFAEGVRQGERYEEDTYRVEPMFDPNVEYTRERNALDRLRAGLAKLERG